MGELINMSGGQLPAHLAAFQTAANNDLTTGVSQGFPILSYKGKVWHLVTGDDRELIANEDNEPLPSVELVIIKANPHISKTYYPNGFEEGSSERPICYSADSVAPAPDSAEPQAKKCAICPHNQFGSKITENGARGKACSDFRRLAVAPSGDLESPMLLRVPAASLKELLAYGQGLNKKGYPYQALVTKVGFDHTVAFPKLTFKALRWLDADEAATVAAMMDDDLVQTITAMNAPTQDVAEAAPDPTDDLPPPPAHVVTAAPVAETPARRKAKVTETEVAAAVAVEPEPAPAEAPAKVKATGFGGGGAKAAPAAEAPATAPSADKSTVLVQGAFAELDSVLGELDD